MTLRFIFVLHKLQVLVRSCHIQLFISSRQPPFTWLPEVSCLCPPSLSTCPSINNEAVHCVYTGGDSVAQCSVFFITSLMSTSKTTDNNKERQPKRTREASWHLPVWVYMSVWVFSRNSLKTAKTIKCNVSVKILSDPGHWYLRELQLHVATEDVSHPRGFSSSNWPLGGFGYFTSVDLHLSWKWFYLQMLQSSLQLHLRENINACALLHYALIYDARADKLSDSVCCKRRSKSRTDRFINTGKLHMD